MELTNVHKEAARDFIVGQVDQSSEKRYQFYAEQKQGGNVLWLATWSTDERQQIPKWDIEHNEIREGIFEYRPPAVWLIEIAAACEIETSYEEAQLVANSILEQLLMRANGDELTTVQQSGTTSV